MRIRIHCVLGRVHSEPIPIARNEPPIKYYFPTTARAFKRSTIQTAAVHIKVY